MPFEFIDNNTTIDRAARKRIRSRAATGKNTNRVLARTSRAVAQRSTVTALFNFPASLRQHRTVRTTPTLVETPIERPFDNGLLFPVQIREEARDLVREALFFFSSIRHNPELDGALINPDHTTSVWIRYFFLDEAYFHCCVAISILCSRSLVQETAQGLRHIARTYRLVQERLTGTEATSDMTIAVLVIMAQYERLQGQYSRGYIHMQGLKRMAELRGGIGSLSRECWGVVQKVLRADLEYSLQLGTRTLFGRDGITALQALGCFGFGNGAAGLGAGLAQDAFLQENLRDDLWRVFLDMRCLSAMLHDASAGYRLKLDGVQFHNTIISLGYRLLEINPLGEGFISTLTKTDLSDLENSIHLGLIAFLVTFLTGLDHRIADKPQLSYRLRLAIQNLSRSVGLGREAGTLLIWTLFIGAVAVFKSSDDEWLIPTTQAAMRGLGLTAWEDVRMTLSGFPWVNALHNRAGIALCSTQSALGFSNQASGLV
ncbi:hypothetical protein BJX61DRAFT_536724 [Aspergillus egyptiacus]|nr:hypothetical protein BJX61DRAFT_536724 [Aspergillus egyptiacus]